MSIESVANVALLDWRWKEGDATSDTELAADAQIRVLVVCKFVPLGVYEEAKLHLVSDCRKAGRDCLVSRSMSRAWPLPLPQPSSVK